MLQNILFSLLDTFPSPGQVVFLSTAPASFNHWILEIWSFELSFQFLLEFAGSSTLFRCCTNDSDLIWPIFYLVAMLVAWDNFSHQNFRHFESPKQFTLFRKFVNIIGNSQSEDIDGAKAYFVTAKCYSMMFRVERNLNCNGYDTLYFGGWSSFLKSFSVQLRNWDEISFQPAMTLLLK